jgi:hypothetical protein
MELPQGSIEAIYDRLTEQLDALPAARQETFKDYLHESDKRRGKTVEANLEVVERIIHRQQPQV